MKNENTVIIIGSGPSGLAVGSCLTRLSIPFIILDRADSVAATWTNRAYDRLHLHLPSRFCEMPKMPFPSHFPRYIPAPLFVNFLTTYAARFRIEPLFGREVESARFDMALERWVVRARVNGESGGVDFEEYFGRFLVVATGEAAEPFVPEIAGLTGFFGEVVHSTEFKTGRGYNGKRVLVVGAGNSGMEIALDLAEHGAETSIIVRSPVHVLSRRIMHIGLVMLSYFSYRVVDYLLVILSKIVYGDLTKYGIKRPQQGPFFMKLNYGKYPLIDVGTFHKIKTGQIQVLQDEIASTTKNNVTLKNGKSYQFDSIVFCTGFKRSTHLWLKGDDYLLNEDGIPKPSYPNHWKGNNGLYCVGLSRRGFYGAKFDAQNIANHINFVMSNTQQ